jgi:asparagine synthase (glutamine-hydrolysing)
MIDFILDISLDNCLTGISNQFVRKPEIRHFFSNDHIEFIAWGDPIIPENFNVQLSNSPTSDCVINTICGHYYFVLFHKKEEVVNIGNSLFSILPVYYCQTGQHVIFSENAFSLSEYSSHPNISNRFILETVLFNYTLFNQSIIEGLQLLPSNSFISVSRKGIKIEKHTRIESFFSESPKPWKKSLAEIRDLFLERVLKYFPNEPYYTSLTGGFDSRTLVSAGLFHDRELCSYAFGNPFSKDIKIASELAKVAKILFLDIALDDDYVKSHSLKCGLEFMHNASGTATFARAHYLYASKQLAEKSKYIITGNFGSEIMRAAHNPGAVLSKNLFQLFNSANQEEAIAAIEKSEEYESLNPDVYEKEWRYLKEELGNLPCFHKDYRMLTQNQKFYVFVIEEVFRKYFGAEMVNQFLHVRNRTPFLDFDFMKAIFNTQLAGIHSDFFEHNPLKRYKGQVLYAYIIQKAYPPFSTIMTDKSYRPDDLIRFIGKLNIIKGYLKKKIQPERSDNDPYSVGRSWEFNKEFLTTVPVDSALFNASTGQSKDLLFKLYSLSYLKAQIESKTNEQKN